MRQDSAAMTPLADGCIPDCPGCPHIRLSAAASLSRKADWLKRRLTPWAEKISDIRSVEERLRWGYRSKVCLSASFNANRWEFGLTKRETLIPIPDCPIHSPAIRRAMALFSRILPRPEGFPLAYFAQSGAQVTLVLKSSRMPDMDWLRGDGIREISQMGIAGLWLHLHPSCGKKVFAKNTWLLVFGASSSRDAHGFVYGPRAFQQVMPALYHNALMRAEDFLAPSQEDLFIDLYCGIGAGLARWTKKCGRVMGVELDGEAVACARLNAPAAEILRGCCADRIPQMGNFAGRPGNGARLLYVNPPRTGLEAAIADWIAGSYRPDRMAYLSCSAGTLSRDLDRLESAGYEILRIIPYDFFPQTLHVETLVLLALQKG